MLSLRFRWKVLPGESSRTAILDPNSACWLQRRLPRYIPWAGGGAGQPALRQMVDAAAKPRRGDEIEWPHRAPRRLTWLRQLLRFPPLQMVRDAMFRTGTVRWFWRYRHVIDRSYRSPQPAVTAPHREQLLSLLVPLIPESVLEVGCGLGENLALIARQVPAVRVAGLDINTQCLKIAANALTAEHRTTAIFREGRAELLPFATASTDVVLSDAVFMYLSEKAARRALAEMLRVTRRVAVVHLFADEDAPESRLIGGNWVHNFPRLLRSVAPDAPIVVREASRNPVGLWVTHGKFYIVGHSL